MADDGKKPTGLLTDSLYEYVTGGKEPTNPSNYNRRIRERIAYGLLDLKVLFEELDEDQVRKLFGPHFAPPVGNKTQEALETAEWISNDDFVDWGALPQASTPGVFAFLLWALNAGGDRIYPPWDEPQPAFEEFISELERGVSLYLGEKEGLTASVDVDITLSDVRRFEELSE